MRYLLLMMVVALWAILLTGCEDEDPTFVLRPYQSSMEQWEKRYQDKLRPFLEVRGRYLQALEQADEQIRERLRPRINGHDRQYALYEKALARADELRPDYDRRLAGLDDLGRSEVEEAVDALVPIVEELSDLYHEMQVSVGEMTWDMDVMIGALGRGR